MQKRVDSDRLIAAYRSGQPTMAIAAELGIAHQTIFKVLKRHGIALRGKPPVTPTEAQGILAAYRDGVLLERIATQYGVTRRTVENVVTREHEPRRTPGPRHQDFSESELNRIAEMRNDGLPIGEILAEMRCGPDRVARAFDQLGLSRARKPRNRKGQIRTHGGYAVVWLPRDDPMARMRFQRTGYVLEHRLVMARSLGRPLESHESVHHVNGNRLDNRLQNLQLRSGKHGKGVVLRCRCCGSHDVEATDIAS